MAFYQREYTAAQILGMLNRSEGRRGTYSGRGHSYQQHSDITNTGLMNRVSGGTAQASAFTGRMSVPYEFVGTRWKSMMVRTNDLPFLVTYVLNSPFGQACLQKLDAAARYTRIVLHAPLPPFADNSPLVALRKFLAVRARFATAGSLSSGTFQGVVIIIDRDATRDATMVRGESITAGVPELHFTTVYPERAMVRPELEIQYGDTGRKIYWHWGSAMIQANHRLFRS